ncbi:hypothetical protein TNCV_243201 [Trichonephila clavipes]|uniref:Uncharacterized protein n=1 Tax=Trichonephila clavipes TaxID=2585209 RepID=A0A8X7BDQ8_TRICX|nr:hypothetical protein TNCV_243201 [Trichonephila clavipes]
MCWCVVMLKIPTITLPELRPFTTNGFLRTTPSRSVYLHRFMQVFVMKIFSNTFRHQRKIFRVPCSRSSYVFMVFDGLSALFKTPKPFINLESRYDSFIIHLT